MTVTGVDYERAETALKDAKGSVKVAVVMILARATAPEATKRLNDAGGFVRTAIETIERDKGKAVS
jgi:N-acetylmuramic acid 6-phosphate etherase